MSDSYKQLTQLHIALKVAVYNAGVAAAKSVAEYEKATHEWDFAERELKKLLGLIPDGEMTSTAFLQAQRETAARARRGDTEAAEVWTHWAQVELEVVAGLPRADIAVAIASWCRRGCPETDGRRLADLWEGKPKPQGFGTLFGRR